MLAYGFGQSVLGIISDYTGRKKIMVPCAAIYVLASILSAFSPNITFLIFYRFIQGLCLGGLATVIRAIAVDVFPGIQLMKAMSNISISWSLGPIIGPAIGSHLQHYWNWQAGFFFFGTYGFIILLAIQFFLPETLRQKTPLSSKTIVRNVKQITSHSIFLCMALIGSFIYALFILFNVIAPFLLENILQYSVIDYGHAALILGLSYCVGNVANRFLINYHHPMAIAQLGLKTALILCTCMVMLSYLLPLRAILIIIPTALLFIVCGFIIPNIFGKFSSLFSEAAGTASALAGLLVALSGGIISLFATQFRINTNLPLVIMQTILVLASFILFWISQRACEYNSNREANIQGSQVI
jgi:predicted MFS family arabinose efflux permease